MNAVILGAYTIEERELSPVDPAGIAHRWKVTGADGIHLVIQTNPGPGRWAGPAAFLCTCRAETPDAPDLPDCEHVVAIRGMLAAARPRPAA